MKNNKEINPTMELLHEMSFNNSFLIRKANKVSCFYCIKVYPASEVIEFTTPRGKDKGTAICPHCSVDTVIPSEVTIEILNEMHKYWFSVEEDCKNKVVVLTVF